MQIGSHASGSVVSLVSCSSASTASSIFDSAGDQNHAAAPSDHTDGETDHFLDDGDDSRYGNGGFVEGSMESYLAFADAESMSSGTSDSQDGSDGSSPSDNSLWRPQTPYTPSDEFEEEYTKQLGLYSGEGGEHLFEQPSLDLSMSIDGSQWPASESTPPYELSEPGIEQDTPIYVPQHVIEGARGNVDSVGPWTVYTDGQISVGADERDEWDELAYWGLHMLVKQHAPVSSQQVIEVIDDIDNAVTEPMDKIWATSEEFEVWVEESLKLKGLLLSPPCRPGSRLFL